MLNGQLNQPIICLFILYLHHSTPSIASSVYLAEHSSHWEPHQLRPYQWHSPSIRRMEHTWVSFHVLTASTLAAPRLLDMPVPTAEHKDTICRLLVSLETCTLETECSSRCRRNAKNQGIHLWLEHRLCVGQGLVLLLNSSHYDRSQSQCQCHERWCSMAGVECLGHWLIPRPYHRRYQPCNNAHLHWVWTSLSSLGVKRGKLRTTTVQSSTSVR